MMLALSDQVKQKYDVSRVSKLLCSSAPARKDTKIGILEFFKNSELYEAYGSTEAGLVTLLRPEDQMKKLGSIGREIFSTDRLKILGMDDQEVPAGEVGELYSRGPALFHRILESARGYRVRLPRANTSPPAIWLAVTRKDTTTWWIARKT